MAQPGVLFLLVNLVVAIFVIASRQVGEHRSLLRTIECLRLMFIFSRLGLAVDHTISLTLQVVSWSHLRDTDDGGRGDGDP